MIITNQPTNQPTNEEWRLIPDYKPFEASSFGRIRNGKTGRILRQRIHLSRGEKVYCKTNLGEGNHGKLVHRLVCLAFHGISNGLQAAHLDDDGTNNRADNLKWMGNAENQSMKRKA